MNNQSGSSSQGDTSTGRSNQSQSAPTFLVGAALILAGLVGLWKAGQDYLTYFGDVKIVEGSRLTRYALGLLGLEFALAAVLVWILWVLWQPPATARLSRWLYNLRARLSWFRYFAAAIPVIILVWFMQHIQLSAALGFSARLILTVGLGLAVAILIAPSSRAGNSKPVSLQPATPELILAWLIIAAVFALAQVFSSVSAYPFSLGWSEGNRFWDYSVLFGHRFYNYPADQPIFAYLDLGRQALWGLPFLFAQIPIWAMRFWNGLLSTLPYAILGWLAFSLPAGQRRISRWVWFLCGIWSFLFLSQGPIYTPLVLSAWLVAIAWRRPLWIALPLVAIAGFYAQITRFTWMFAPAIWGVMLFFSDLGPPASNDVIASRTSAKQSQPVNRWVQSIAVFLAGAIGGYLIPQWVDINKLAGAATIPATAASESGAAGLDVATASGLSAFISRQPLIWERLLPNPTFGPGILLALLIAAAPLILFLVYLVKSGRWPLKLLSGAAIVLPLLAFLAVGLVASVKIGGGGDLHNMDMFLITLVFAAALAWRAGGHETILHIDRQKIWIQGLWLLMTLIFAQQAMLDSTPIRIPSTAKANEALEYIQKQVSSASARGEVLFLDQRQLLTFDNMPQIPLVVDYEKKYLMDQAMANNAGYFAKFHKDLANQRFKLILSEPLKIVFHGGEYHFGDENDAWVKWVAQPILCYYEPLKTFKEVKVELLVPRTTPAGDECPK